MAWLEKWVYVELVGEEHMGRPLGLELVH